MTALPSKRYSVTTQTAGGGKRTTKEHLKKDLEREMWTAGFGFSWRKMETAAQDRAEWRRVICGL